MNKINMIRSADVNSCSLRKFDSVLQTVSSAEVSVRPTHEQFIGDVELRRYCDISLIHSINSAHHRNTKGQDLAMANRRCRMLEVLLIENWIK